VTRPTIVLDCDPGHDDAVAIVLAGRHADTLSITTVSGNAPLSATTRNALMTTQIAGLDVPVHAGAARPLVAPPRFAPEIHGETGLDGPVLPELTRAPAGRDAVATLLQAARDHDDLWVVAVGPLTNVALAIRADPGFADRLAGISIMGGGIGVGNVTPAAEFNIWADPEAAAVVFGCGAPVRMCGLDLTRQFEVDEAVIGRLRQIGNEVATFVADLFDHYCAAIEARSGIRRAALHDPCAVLAVTHPELFTVDELAVEVELTGRHTRGMTLADQRGFVGGASPNVQVMRTIDRSAGLEILFDTIAGH
jgi:inosine-uridine nucleoside N-ribohydrolase